MRALLLVVVGCSHPALLGVEAERITAAYGQPPVHPGIVWFGTCSPDLAVRVVDAAGAGVAGARVWIHQRVSARLSEEPMGSVEYKTIPVESGLDGWVRICGESQVPPISPLQGIGGGSESGHGGEVVAELGERRGTLRKPFRGPLVIK